MSICSVVPSLALQTQLRKDVNEPAALRNTEASLLHVTALAAERGLRPSCAQATLAVTHSPTAFFVARLLVLSPRRTLGALLVRD